MSSLCMGQAIEKGKQGSSSMKRDTHSNAFPEPKSKKAKTAGVSSSNLPSTYEESASLKLDCAGSVDTWGVDIGEIENADPKSTIYIDSTMKHFSSNAKDSNFESSNKKCSSEANSKEARATGIFTGLDLEKEKCRCCLKMEYPGGACPYRDNVPAGAAVGPGYVINCYCGRYVGNWSKTWSCDLCGSIRGRASAKQCLLCNSMYDHSSFECPVDRKGAADRLRRLKLVKLIT